MKRTIILALGAVALMGATSPLPVFEYKGIRAGESVDLSQQPECRSSEVSSEALLRSYKAAGLTPPDKDLRVCGEERPIGGVPIQGEKITFYQNRLTALTLIADPGDYGKLVEAFQAKYGAPCRQGKSDQQTVGGADVESPFQIWCFASGELKVDMYFPDLDTMMVTYQDKWQPPKAAPVVDF